MDRQWFMWREGWISSRGKVKDRQDRQWRATDYHCHVRGIKVGLPPVTFYHALLDTLHWTLYTGLVHS